jgi:hypothetical protein
VSPSSSLALFLSSTLCLASSFRLLLSRFFPRLQAGQSLIPDTSTRGSQQAIYDGSSPISSSKESYGSSQEPKQDVINGQVNYPPRDKDEPTFSSTNQQKQCNSLINLINPSHPFIECLLIISIHLYLRMWIIRGLILFLSLPLSREERQFCRHHLNIEVRRWGGKRRLGRIWLCFVRAIGRIGVG